MMVAENKGVRTYTNLIPTWGTERLFTTERMMGEKEPAGEVTW